MYKPHREFSDREYHLMNAVREQVVALYRSQRQQMSSAVDQARSQLTLAMQDCELTPEVAAAEAALRAAINAESNFEGDMELATEELVFIAGQRDGLRRGIQIAGLLLAGAPVAGIEHSRASLVVAGALVDDRQADELLDAIKQAEAPDPLLEVG